MVSQTSENIRAAGGEVNKKINGRERAGMPQAGLKQVVASETLNHKVQGEAKQSPGLSRPRGLLRRLRVLAMTFRLRGAKEDSCPIHWAVFVLDGHTVPPGNRAATTRLPVKQERPPALCEGLFLSVLRMICRSLTGHSTWGRDHSYRDS